MAIQPQRLRQRIHHRPRRTPPALLQPPDMFLRYVRQPRQLIAAQARHAARRWRCRPDPGRLRAQPLAERPQQRTELIIPLPRPRTRPLRQRRAVLPQFQHLRRVQGAARGVCGVEGLRAYRGAQPLAI